MKLYLMQHGEAMSKFENPERPLTDDGRKNATKVAAFLAQAGIHIDQIRHSGKCRAEQTAAIVAEYLRIPDAITAISGLDPNDDVLPIAADLRREPRNVMLVGHLPFLSRLANLLLIGDAERAVLQFTNAGVACLERQENGWGVGWIIVPKLLP